MIDREIEGETVLLDLKSGVYYSLNEVGSEIWRLLADKATEEELVDAITAKYEVAKDEAARDVSELIKDLSGEGLIIGETGQTP
ncbi:MAG: PqqD family protein [bacterium]